MQGRGGLSLSQEWRVMFIRNVEGDKGAPRICEAEEGKWQNAEMADNQYRMLVLIFYNFFVRGHLNNFSTINQFQIVGSDPLTFGSVCEHNLIKSHTHEGSNSPPSCHSIL